ncbi:unnamed protein product [Ambrosiozyma monospora]|uniref:Unnamed protein product n=1 Tax=Ambrosiozyma monospora TaxID=43982 RepID=A0ACB5TVT1_AMBMO|nr:unnamed protein product [Ambrosiozyma monospora]
MHPLSTKQACIGVRRSGEVCLWHQEEHGIEYRRVSTKLPFNNPDDEIVNTSIGFQRDGKIIIAAYFAIARSVKVYEVTINWGYLLEAAKRIQTNPNYSVPEGQRVQPTLMVKKILQIDVNRFDPECSVLTNLDLMSPNYHQSTSMEVLLSFENQRSFNREPVKTVLYRFQLEAISQMTKLHSAFQSIGSKKGVDVKNIKSEETYELKYKQRLEFNDSLLSMEILNLDMIMGFVFASGELKFFDRNNFEQIKNLYNQDSPVADPLLPNTINTLFDAGFEFSRMPFQPKYVIISPNMCCYVSLPLNDSNLHVSVIKCEVKPENLPPKRKGLLLATTVSIALRHTSACYFGYCTDDIVAAIKVELWRCSKLIGDKYSYRLLVSILQECQTAISLNIDISTEQMDKMSQNQPLQRMLALQFLLPHR